MPAMIRKQLYISPEQNRKLKELAAQRRTTEADVLREAIERLPAPKGESPLAAELRAAGLLAPKPPLPPELQGLSDEELDALDAELWERLKHSKATLSDAVLQEREESPY
jgi:hypothetical protein